MKSVDVRALATGTGFVLAVIIGFPIIAANYAVYRLAAWVVSKTQPGWSRLDRPGWKMDCTRCMHLNRTRG